MQSVFFLSLFSLLFLMFSGITTGLSKNLQQENLDRIEFTKEMFEDVKHAITVTAFKQKISGKSVVDLSNADITNLNGTFLAGHTNYAKSELSKDAWGSTIYLMQKNEYVTLWGGASGQKAQAPITTIMILSAGPDQKYDTLTTMGLVTNNPTLAQLKAFDITNPSSVNDDIVIRFSTYDAMLDVWNAVEDIDNDVKNLSYDYYRSQLDAFSPLIQLAQRDTVDGVLKSGVFDNVVDVNAEYNPFSDLENASNTTTLTNEWNDVSNPLYTKLIKYRTSKPFEATDFSLPADALVDFPVRNYLYPTFDIVKAEDGFENIGASSISSLDPFNGIDGEINYDYSTQLTKPEQILLTRSSIDTSGTGKNWVINKKLIINGLGEL